MFVFNAASYVVWAFLQALVTLAAKSALFLAIFAQSVWAYSSMYFMILESQSSVSESTSEGGILVF